jgi:adenosylhomocysteine nucleosidase
VIAVTFALAAESRDFRKLLTKTKREVHGDLQITTGLLGGRSVAILHTGVGEKIARARIASLLSRTELEHLISAGFAGALDPNLRVGDVVIGENYSSADIMERAKRLLSSRAHIGALATCNAVVETAAQRERLKHDANAIAADMETEFIHAPCVQRGIAMLSLRVISDTTDQPFPCPPDVLFDIDQQKTNPRVLANYLVRHPRAIPRLLRFARQIATARKNLATALEQYLA